MEGVCSTGRVETYTALHVRRITGTQVGLQSHSITGTQHGSQARTSDVNVTSDRRARVHQVGGPVSCSPIDELVDEEVEEDQRRYHDAQEPLAARSGAVR